MIYYEAVMEAMKTIKKYWMNDRAKLVYRSTREWKIAIISAVIGAIIGLIPTIIQFIV